MPTTHAKRICPPEPIIFKATPALPGRTTTSSSPVFRQMDWEVGFAAVIGTKAQHHRRQGAGVRCRLHHPQHVRCFQFRRASGQRQGCDTFAPIGPWLVTTDEITDPQNSDMWLDVNSDRMQTGADHDFNVAVGRLLQPVLRRPATSTTGTPPGGYGQSPNPPAQARRRDARIKGLGEQRQKVVAANNRGAPY